MTMIKVNFGALETGSGDIKTSYGSLQSMFGDLQSMVNQLLPTWDGAAKVAYQGVQQAWNQLNQTLNDGLDNMGTGVQNAHDTFVQAEQANTNIWGA